MAMNLNKVPNANRFFSPPFLLRSCFRFLETIARVFLLAFAWCMFGYVTVLIVMGIDWLIYFYNFYVRHRYDEDDILILHPILADDILSLATLGIRLRYTKICNERNVPEKQNKYFDIVDHIQGWIIAYHLYNPRWMRRFLRHRPNCMCQSMMEEYWASLDLTREPQVSKIDIRFVIFFIFIFFIFFIFYIYILFYFIFYFILFFFFFFFSKMFAMLGSYIT